ncbi:MAG: FAD-dependent oxidoreductase [candidate division NC10 bacterium]|nr:FAD-dependent oxidoreductase [candidate division NC10 bacterium]
MAEGHRRYRVEIPDIEYYQRMIECRYGCPVHTDAKGYVTAIAEGDYEKAYIIAKEPNPFASICGRVCAAPCEVTCRRGAIDAPVAIRALKRFVTERFGVEAPLSLGKGSGKAAEEMGLDLVIQGGYSLEGTNFQDASTLKRLAGTLGVSDRRARNTGPRVAVIGSGCAGLTCAHDLALLGYRVTVFEKQAIPGGMLILGVPEYRLPRDLIQAEIQAILDLEVELRTNTALGQDLFIKDLKNQGYQAIFIAIGAHMSRELRIEGVQMDGVLRAIEFLLNVNLGFKVDLGERVIVVGGGDVAMDAARSAAREILDAEVRAALEAFRPDVLEATEAMRRAMEVAREAMRKGAREVNVICLESWEEMPAQRFEVEEAQSEGVKIYPRLGPKRILGDNGRVKGLETLAVKSVFDEQGRFNPSFIEGSEAVMEADSVILAIGQTSDLSWIRPEDGIEVTPRGTIKIDPETMATTAPGIYAGGDVAVGPRIFIEAVEHGHRAARAIHEYLSHRKLREVKLAWWIPIDYRKRLLEKERPEGPFLPTYYPNYHRLERYLPPSLPIERRIGIAEIELGYEEAMAREQGIRCLKCHINTIFHGERCILCGACVDVCPEYCLKFVRLDQVVGGEEVSRLIELSLGSSLKDFQKGDPDLLRKATVMIMDLEKCIRCALCAIRCPTDAITMETFHFQEELVCQ